MAKINTTFSYQDGITQGLNRLIKTLKGVEQTLKGTENGLKGANPELEKTSEAAKKAKGGLTSLTQKLLNFNLAFDALNKVRGAVNGVTGSVAALNAAWQAQQDSEARLGAVMTARFHSNAQGIAEMTEYLDDFSKGSAYNKTMLTNAAQELGTYIESADTLKGLLPMLTSMSQQAGIANEQGLMSMATMIGKVMGGDMGGLSKRGWQFTEEEKKAFKTMSEMERLNFLVKTAKENIGEQDKAIAEMMANLAKQRNLENLQMKLGGLFNPMFDAIGQAKIAIQTEFLERIIPIVERISPVFDQMVVWVTNTTAAIHSAIDTLVLIIQERIQDVMKIIEQVSDGFYGVMDGIRENLNGIAIAITAAGTIIIASLIAVGTWYLWTSRVAIAGYITHLRRGIVIALAHAKASIAAAVASAKAWAAANAPLLITIGIIIAIIAAIGLLLAHSEKTFPLIAGFFSGVGEAAKAVGNNIRYYFLTAIEKVVQGFQKLKSKIADIFLGIVDKVLSAALKIAPIIDKAFPDFSERVSGMKATINELRDASYTPFTFADKGETVNIGEQWRLGVENGRLAGANASDKFQSWISDKLAWIKNLIPQKKGVEELNGVDKDGKSVEDMIKNALDDKFSTDGTGALKTSDKGIIEISADYKELLSNAATRRFNATFKNVAPSINVGGVTFNDTGSFDTFVSQLADGIRNVSSSSLESA